MLPSNAFAMCTLLVLLACGIVSVNAQNFQPQDPQMMTDDGSIVIKVMEGKDVTFKAGNFSIAATKIPGMIQEAIDTAVKGVDERANKTSADLKASSKAVDTLTASLSAFPGQVKAMLAAATKDLATKAELKTTSDAASRLKTTSDAAKKISDALASDFSAAMACVASGKVVVAGKCVELQTAGDYTMQVASQYMSDRRQTGCWQSDSTRKGTFVRKDAITWTKATYSETLMSYQTRGTTACRWRLLINGKAYREHWAHSWGAGGGWRIQPVTLYTWYSPSETNNGGSTAVFSTVKGAGGPAVNNFEWQSCKQAGASECSQGWPNSATENLITFEEVSPSLVGIRRYMRDVRPASTGWQSLTDRYIKYTAKNTGSHLIVTYSDTVGADMVGHTDACGTRILVNGKALTGNDEFRSHSSTARGWRIWPGSFRWMIPSNMVKKGATFAVQVQNRRSSGASSCLYGWSNGQNHNVLSVEEITPTAQKLMAFTKPNAFSDQRPTSSKYIAVAGRSVEYTKQHDKSLLKITLTDSTGMEMKAHTMGCQTRLYANGKPYDMKEKITHAGTKTGWRIQGTNQVWLCKTCPKTKITFQIMSKMGAGAKDCLFGWPTKVGFLQVEEIPL